MTSTGTIYNVVRATKWNQTPEVVEQHMSFTDADAEVAMFVDDYCACVPLWCAIKVKRSGDTRTIIVDGTEEAWFSIKTVLNDVYS